MIPVTIKVEYFMNKSNFMKQLQNVTNNLGTQELRFSFLHRNLDEKPNFNEVYKIVSDVYQTLHLNLKDTNAYFHFKPNSPESLNNTPGSYDEILGCKMKDIKVIPCHNHSAETVRHDYVVVGGTFDRFHHGHSLLLTVAGLICKKKIFVGLSSDEFIRGKYLWEMIQPYSEREKKILQFLENSFPEIDVDVVPLNDSIGISGTEKLLSVLVLTEETESAVSKINDSRSSRGLSPLSYYVLNNMMEPNPHFFSFLKGKTDEDTENPVVELKVTHPAASNFVGRFSKLSSSLLRFCDLGNLILQPTSHTNNNPFNKYIIGVTGCIASGKTSVCTKLKLSLHKNGFDSKIINCDIMAHQSYKKGTMCFNELIDIFGTNIIDNSTGEIDRKKLSLFVMQNTKRMDTLNSIVWKYTKELVVNEIRLIESKVIIIEAALLFEAGWDHQCNEIWVTWVDEKDAIERQKLRNQVSDTEAKMRYQMSQRLMTNKEKIGKAHILMSTLEDPHITQLIIDRNINQRIDFLKKYASSK